MPNDDTLPPNTPQPPTDTAINWTTAAKVIGAILSLIAYGYKDAVANHPDVISAMGSWTDWASVMGVLAVVGGSLMAHNNIAKTKANAAAQAAAPPMNSEGERGARITVGSAVKQAIHEEDDDLAAALVAALGKGKS